MSKRILVTGGAGYIGCVLVPKLLDKGYRVRVLDKLVFGAQGLDDVIDQIELIVGDIRDVNTLGHRRATLNDIDAVIHLAGLSNDPTAEYNPVANTSINTKGTATLAHYCKLAGIRRFLFASSCSVYYTMRPDDTLRDEEYPINPTAPYSQSKYEAERALLEMTDDSFYPIILRQGTIFGPSPRKRYDLVVNAFTKDAFQHRRLTIHAGGRMWRPMLHIDDAADAYIACLEDTVLDEGNHGQVFNVLSGNHRVIDIAYKVRHALEVNKGIKLDMEVQQVGAMRSYRVSGVKFEQAFGPILHRDIGLAASDMWDQLEDGVDLDDPIYYNLRWLELLDDMRERLGVMGGSPLD